jgi:hypothetical protein
MFCHEKGKKKQDEIAGMGDWGIGMRGTDVEQKAIKRTKENFGF